MKHVIAIGYSAGGLNPVQEIIHSLPASLPAPILIVTHRSSENQPFFLKDILNRTVSLPAKIAETGEIIKCGTVYISKPGYHFLINPKGEINLSLGPKIDGFRPSINGLFKSVAEIFKDKAIGIILSGALYDGTNGLLAIKANGGMTIVQDLEEAEFPWMPLAALKQDGKIDYVLKAKEIETLLKEVVHEK